MNMDISQIFKDSFDSFKAFDNLTPEQASQISDNTPKSLWQILNHLIIWQDHQLQLLRDETTKTSIDEMNTWNVESSVPSHDVLLSKVNEIKRQIKSIKLEINKISPTDENYQSKAKIILEMTTHFSFHLGEIILLRRMHRNYPWPDNMKEFLNED
jgi:hypothetical protein